MKTLTNYTRIRRTINALQVCYTDQKIDRDLITRCLKNVEFQSKYVNY
jgi:hypothetical protein